MKNDPKHLDENELDFLLRQLMLEEGDDQFTQNTLNMNADFLFSSTAVSPAMSREAEMIRQLERDFITQGPKKRFWLNGILLLLLFSGAFWIYKMNSGDNASLKKPSPENKNTSALVPVADTVVKEKTPVAENPFVPEVLSLPANDSVKTDSAHSETTAPEEHFTTPDSHMPVEPDWYSGNYIATPPNPSFSAVPSPENFNPVSVVFSVDTDRTGSVMFRTKQTSFTATYYKGEPFKKGLNDMQYFNLGQYAQDPDVKHWTLPGTLLYYADTVNDATVEKTGFINYKNQPQYYTDITLRQLPQKGIELAIEPFYFRRYEVTNKEYREFLNWVRAANGYANKPICNIDIDTVADDQKNNGGGEPVTIKGKKYLIQRKSTPTEDYKDVFNYIFFNTNSEAVKALGKKSLYIFPDTSAWISDFTFSYNEPMSNYYFWHPAYENYPVTGVSWFQALAFLDWKTHMHQEQLNKENIPYEVEYTLPSEIEWELASTLTTEGKSTFSDSYYQSSYDWLTDLAVSFSSGNDAKYDQYNRNNYLKNLFIKDESYPGDYMSDGFFHTAPADLSFQSNLAAQGLKTHHLGPGNISWLDGNVSEWMMESYAVNWKPFFLRHLLVLGNDPSESIRLAMEIEKMYDKGNAANGRLVRGANWYDERFGGKPGSDRNEAGMSPKRFVDPAEQHCTIGFRYVLHVKRK